MRCQAYENAAQTYPGDRIPNTTNKTHYFYCGSVKGWNMAHNEVTQLSSYTRNLLKAKLGVNAPTGVTYYVFKNYDEAKAWILAEKGFNIPIEARNSTRGFSFDDENFSIIYEKWYPTDTATTPIDLSDSDFRGTINHESGHQLDYRYDLQLSTGQFFKTLVNQDKAVYNAKAFCFIWASKCSGGLPVSPYDNATLYPVATRNYKVLTETYPADYFNPVTARQWREYWAEQYADTENPGTDTGIDSHFAQLLCSRRWAGWVRDHGVTTPPTTGWATGCSKPSDPIPTLPPQ